ncbi:MAG: hypothetical protein GTN38_00920 [Candidatus Aenigmarchaeota archaeon]|nr:hypothetical protein [Candidatus Aenigmarchaeota archaeon]NIP40149.1 hypothetical protein [Candidatus Aenigmarchaeota archaeon]NIQ18226.1 hypothetical protein [Candidatus Aenigmarchaeota archaeon]NIS72983.1 hypothetical protein [Candidatus Aenigmarchaeota archaeon]
MIKKKKLTEYKNFWLIWLNAASDQKGTSLFRIQTEWGVKTNYLYHIESGIGKPLFRQMIKENYIVKEGKRLKPLFGWIPGYMRGKHRKIPEESWTPNSLIVGNWNIIQKFIEKYHPLLFSPKNLKVLYRGDKEMVGRYGSNIFTDVFLYVLFSNMIVFCKKYKADIVPRIISTLISLSGERDLLNYTHQLNSQLSKINDFPVLARNENELSKILCTLKW